MEVKSRFLYGANFRIVIFLILACGISGPVWGQTSPTTGQAGANAASQAGDANPGGVDAGNLDKLLDIAEKGDVSQLSQVNVAGHTGSASLDMPVSSVERQESTVGKTPAAVFVITNEMIRRSGARSIPEALRMAPGLEVAQMDTGKWGISCRGFNQLYADKLLVLIDGRNVYNQTFGGVYWDMIDTLLEDIDHIEVIRGPGGTLWGANAVNGVISIITKSAKNSQGTYAYAGGGTNERDTVGARYGGQVGDFSYRAYGKSFDRKGGVRDTTASDDFDAMHQQRAGFRTDWDLDKNKSNHLTVQGDFFNGDTGGFSARTVLNTNGTGSNSSVTKDEPLSGENVLLRWSHIRNEQSDWALQLYYDSYKRNNVMLLDTANTIDLDFQYRFPMGDRHEIVWGLGYRQIHDRLVGADWFTQHYDPSELTTNLASAFIQDEIMLVKDKLALFLGTKLEQNYFTAFEAQPSVRLLWTPDKKRSAWAAVSRAVRTPTRDNTALYNSVWLSSGSFQRINGNPDVESESLVAFELGYRVQATKRFSWDLALFDNHYQGLIDPSRQSNFTESWPTPAHAVQPWIFDNVSPAHNYGAELAMNYTATEHWRLYAQYTVFEMDHLTVPYIERLNRTSPSNMAYIWSSWDLTPNVDFDLMWRYVDDLPTWTNSNLGIDSYNTMDARLAWRPRKHLEMAIVAQNLFDYYHNEFRLDTKIHGGDYREQSGVPRSIYGTISYRY